MRPMVGGHLRRNRGGYREARPSAHRHAQHGGARSDRRRTHAPHRACVSRVERGYWSVVTVTMRAPFPYFGGKSSLASDVWARLGSPAQYIEPFCGSAAVLLAAPKPASLEVVCDASGFIANFWRAVKYRPAAVAEWADYPVSHIDLGARHIWLMAQIERVGVALQDCNWPGDAQVAGFWLWGQCSWIGSGWCDWSRGTTPKGMGKIPNVNAGFGGGVGINAIGKVPHASNAGMGYDALLTSSGRAAWQWMHKLADRLERVRVVHGNWSRCLNNHFGGSDTAIFLDPPYRSYEKLYGDAAPVADEVEAWAREHDDLRIALCGHRGDYDLPGWTIQEWSRGRLTYGGAKTTDQECVWYSPACLSVEHQSDLFAQVVV
jgi:DNA adenine methylase